MRLVILHVFYLISRRKEGGKNQLRFMEDLIESSCEIGLLVNVGRKFYTCECSELGQDNDGQIISSINVIVLFTSFCACLFFSIGVSKKFKML